MSEGTFRAVVASVLVGALVLAILAVAVLLPRPAQPSPAPSGPVKPASPSPSAASAASTASSGPAFAALGVVGIGTIAPGSSSGPTLVVTLNEPGVDAIPDAPGSLRLTLTDSAGDGSTVTFTGTPAVGAPGSLGATATLVAPNVLLVSVVAADLYNIEPITISGLGIRATATAAPGPLVLVAGEFSGSLGGGLASATVPSPGTIGTP